MNSRRPLYIFDIDGTIARIEHRRHILGEKHDPHRWRRFYAACVRDSPNWPVIDTMEALMKVGAEVWLFSGRSSEVREQTEWWLLTYTPFAPEDFETKLMMRDAGDHTRDDVLKQKWLHGMLEIDRARICASFDDRDRVVAMWRRNGVTCFQVAEGNF